MCVRARVRKVSEGATRDAARRPTTKTAFGNTTSREHVNKRTLSSVFIGDFLQLGIFHYSFALSLALSLRENREFVRACVCAQHAYSNRNNRHCGNSVRDRRTCAGARREFIDVFVCVKVIAHRGVCACPRVCDPESVELAWTPLLRYKV